MQETINELKYLNEYVFDVKIYERALVSELPMIRFKEDMRDLQYMHSGTPRDAMYELADIVLKEGYQQWHAYMTEDDMEAFLAFAGTKSFIKVIGVHCIAESVKPQADDSKQNVDLPLREDTHDPERETDNV